MPTRSRPRPEPSSGEPEADRLYALPLGEFSRVRDALAARLRKEGRAGEADAVKALTKPVPPVWAINQVAREAAAAIHGLLGAVAELRAAQEGGRVALLGEATRAERAAVDLVTDLVRRRLTEAGFRDSPEMLARATATLRGAAADPSHHDELRAGVLKTELRAPGFEALAGGAPPAERAGRDEKPAKPSPRGASPAERREHERLERAREALRVAEAELADWTRRAEELERVAAERREAAEEAGRAADDLRARLDDARTRLADEQRAAEQADREAARARRDAASAAARVDAARRAAAS